MAADTSYFDASVRSLFRRCVQCPSTVPSCPSCASDETCQLSSQSCDACASTTCVKIGTLPGQLATSTSTPIGPIVGGVIGGVVAVAVAGFLLYWFYIRPRRQAMQAWDSPEKRDQSTMHPADRQSTRSVASTVLTRASNVIQIAYIPGVTVRSPPDSPGILPPPMPSFPGASVSSSAASTPAVEQHFFMPSDLRASTWSAASGASSTDPRVSMAPSLARTTLYGEGAIIAPAQQAARVQANMVSVKPGSTTPSGSATPPVPQVPKLGNSGSSIVAKNVRAAPIEIKKSGSGQRVPTLGNLAKEASRKKTDSTSASERSVPVFFDEKEVATPSESRTDTPVSPFVRPKPSFASATSARSSSVSAILPSEGPLGSGNTTTHRHSKSEGLNAMIEEAINRARDPHVSVRPDAKRSDSGPFSDANEVKENL